MSTVPVPPPTRPAEAASGRDLTGWALRALLAAATAGLVLAAIVGLEGAQFGAAPVVLAVIAAAAVGCLPSSPAPLAVCALVIVLFTAGDPGFQIWLVVGASLLHTVHVLGGLAGVIPARARVEYPALAPTFRRWVRTQAVTVPVLVVLVALF